MIDPKRLTSLAPLLTFQRTTIYAASRVVQVNGAGCPRHGPGLRQPVFSVIMNGLKVRALDVDGHIPVTFSDPSLATPQVLVTASARASQHGRRIMERAGALGVPIIELPGDRLVLNLPEDPRQAYIEAKGTVAVVVAPP
ncbi:MAG: radical protein [Sphingomonadales bacterium]|nr:radical protein [Sphingomonadales bacterium]